MKPQLGAVTLAVALAALMSAAAPPVALRVETAAIRAEGDGALIAVTVQVAPEDRSRLGRDVWVQCKLLRAGRRVQRLARALDLDERGEAFIITLCEVEILQICNRSQCVCFFDHQWYNGFLQTLRGCQFPLTVIG